MTDRVVVGVRRTECIPHYCGECQRDIYILTVHWPPGKLDDTTFLCRQCVTERAKRAFAEADQETKPAKTPPTTHQEAP
jgi:hypothetical protein